jgi:hypothetical protein
MRRAAGHKEPSSVLAPFVQISLAHSLNQLHRRNQRAILGVGCNYRNLNATLPLAHTAPAVE